MITVEQLETPRLIILPFGEQHLTSRYVSWLNDRDVTRYSEQRHRQHTVESCRRHWSDLQTSSNIFWAVESPKEFGHIGNITARIDYPNGVVDIAILLGEKSVWGKGYGSEAFKAVCTWFLRKHHMRKISAGTMASNLAMRGIMRSVGMVEDGFRARQYLLDGNEVDAVYGALYRTDAVK